MNKIFLALFVIFVVGISTYYVITPRKNVSSSTRQGNNQEEMNNKPIAQSHRSYELEVTSNLTNIKPQQKTRITYKIKNDKGEVLKNYETVHEKVMHFILVRHDLQEFQHIHPQFDQTTGEFRIDVTFPTDGPYRIFPDFTPAKSEDNPMSLAVTLYKDVNVGNLANYKAQEVVADTGAKKPIGTYMITHIFPTQDELKAQKELTYSLIVEKDGQPVTNLQDYLGALGHSVIIRKDNFDFIHTHPKTTASDTSKGDHSMMMKETKSTGPQIDFSVDFPESGTYKVFTQFQHQDKVLTTDYVIDVQ